MTSLSKSATAQNNPTIRGKVYAGDITDAHPHYDYSECLVGTLIKDLKGRFGEDPVDVRTSPVQEIIVMENGDTFAITLNSVYRLLNLRFGEFLADKFWTGKFASAIANAVSAPEYNSTEVVAIHKVSPDIFQNMVDNLKTSFEHCDGASYQTGRQLQVGSEIFVEVK